MSMISAMVSFRSITFHLPILTNQLPGKCQFLRCIAPSVRLQYLHEGNLIKRKSFSPIGWRRIRPTKVPIHCLMLLQSALKAGEYDLGMTKRGNPSWGHTSGIAAATATEFEVQARRLGLTKEQYSNSAQLRMWCEHNRNRCYIPEWLLGEWGILVNPLATAK